MEFLMYIKTYLTNIYIKHYFFVKDQIDCVWHIWHIKKKKKISFLDAFAYKQSFGINIFIAIVLMTICNTISE